MNDQSQNRLASVETRLAALEATVSQLNEAWNRVVVSWRDGVAKLEANLEARKKELENG